MQTQSAAQLAESDTRKRQLEATQLDCKRLCILDNNTPFVDGKDAFDRLIPWHVSFNARGCRWHPEAPLNTQPIDLLDLLDLQVLGADDAIDTDLDDKEAAELAKHEAWLEACHRNTVVNIERLQATANRLGQFPASFSPNKAGTAIEKVLLEKLLLEEERAYLTRARTEERDKLQLEQLRQTPALNQRGLQGAAQATPVLPGAAPLQLPQPVQQPLAWSSPVPSSSVVEQATKPPATASGFRSFSITGRAKPPS